MQAKRFATVKTSAPSQIEAYLPANYEVLGVLADGTVVIGGEDNSGWTLHSYVIPRLASGLHWATEITAHEAEILVG